MAIIFHFVNTGDLFHWKGRCFARDFQGNRQIDLCGNSRAIIENYSVKRSIVNYYHCVYIYTSARIVFNAVIGQTSRGKLLNMVP